MLDPPHLHRAGGTNQMEDNETSLKEKTPARRQGPRRFRTCRFRIRVNGKDGKKYLAHTLNNTVAAPPRMLIAFLENNLNADGSVNIPVALRPYMGGIEKIFPKK